MHMHIHVRARTSQWLRLHVLYVVSFIDLLAVSLIIPSLASYIKSLEGGALAFGGIMSMYGLLQFFSAPLAGSLSDVYGRRRVLQVCFLGAASGYVLLAVSWSIPLVILSRIPPALFKHSLDLIKVAATDGLASDARASAIGRLNGAASAGFILGPVLGGYLTQTLPHGFNYTTLLTTALFLVNFALITVFFEDHAPAVGVTDSCSSSSSSGSNKREPTAATTTVSIGAVVKQTGDKLLVFRGMLRQRGPAQTLLLARLLLAMAAILYRTHFSAMLEDKFGSDAAARGWVLSYMGALGALGSLGVGIATSLVRSERVLLQLASVVYVATFLALSRAQSLPAVYALLAPQVLAISVLRACSIGLQTTFVDPERIGAFMGVSASLTSIARTVSPILSGWTYLVALDGPAYGAALLAGTSASLFCLSPHFQRPSSAVTSSSTSTAKASPASSIRKSKRAMD